MVFPGIVALKLFPGTTESNLVYPKLTTLLPIGIKGIVIAGLYAAIMSSLAACFNSCGTLFTMDLYKPSRPHASDRELVFVGRVVTVIMVVVGLLYVPMMKHLGGSQLYKYLQSVQAYISPPIAAVFLFGVLWKRINGQGALAALYTGFVLGIGRLFLEFGHNAYKWSLGPVEPLITMNFLHFAIVLFVVCVTVMIVVSLATPAQTDTRLKGLTFATTPRDAHAVDIEEGTRAGRRATVIGTVVLALIVIALWVTFYIVIPMRTGI
jgi:SSS family solute:Na+ symporter